ncbi:hypothetical protein [Bowmanella denitrificans]|nr:hypothetical protein [Bowmanella denitrificans]
MVFFVKIDTDFSAKGLAGRPHFTRWLKSVTGVVFIGFGAKLAYLKP